jgi:hypothetical protein
MKLVFILIIIGIALSLVRFKTRGREDWIKVLAKIERYNYDIMNILQGLVGKTEVIAYLHLSEDGKNMKLYLLMNEKQAAELIEKPTEIKLPDFTSGNYSIYLFDFHLKHVNSHVTAFFNESNGVFYTLTDWNMDNDDNNDEFVKKLKISFEDQIIGATKGKIVSEVDNELKKLISNARNSELENLTQGLKNEFSIDKLYEL